MKYNKGDVVRMVRIGGGKHPLTITGEVHEAMTSPAMPGTYLIQLVGSYEAYPSAQYDIEVIETFEPDYPDGVYVIDGDQDDESLTEYIIIQRVWGEWKTLTQDVKPPHNTLSFLENVKAGKCKMVRLVKEA